MARTFVLALGLSLAAHTVSAVQIDSVLVPDSALKTVKAPAALRLAEATGVPPLATLRAASAGAGDQLDAIAAWNRSGGKPTKNGFARPLPLPKTVRFSADLLKTQPATLAGGALLAPPSGGLVWGAEVRVEGSHRLRLHLSGVSLPHGTRLWVYGEEGSTEETSVAVEEVSDPSGLWTPSVAGPVIRLEVKLPETGVEGAHFSLDRVLESFDLDDRGAPLLGSVSAPEDFSCAQDAACYTSSSLASLDTYKHAVALLSFVDGGDTFLCSGGLMNDTDDSTVIPYLLTAHHCFSTQAAASTLEAFFDYIDPTCNGSAPTLDSRPRANGATLLATGAGSDFTFVRLASLPPGRGLLGSTSDPVASGTVLHRLSHPLGITMGYSVTTATSGGPICSGIARPDFIYSLRSLGGVFEGSSGSPVVRAQDGRVVGQLLGVCGPTATDDEGCDSSNSVIDGALSQTWPSISQYLSPPVTTNPFPCVATATAMCLSGGRFQVTATFDTGTQSGQAQAVPLSADTGYLWFFQASNVETVVKVLNGCALNQSYWVFAGGLTNVSVVLTVTDTQTGVIKNYTNAQGTAFLPIQDTAAFATCP